MKILRVFQRVDETGEVQVDLIPIHQVNRMRCVYRPEKAPDNDNDSVRKTNGTNVNLNNVLAITTKTGNEYRWTCNGSERFTIIDEKEKVYFSEKSLEKLSCEFVKHVLQHEEDLDVGTSKTHQ